MAYEILVTLSVSDQEAFAQYRAEIRPLLERAGAAFRYDFEIAKVLKPETETDLNRVFVLAFPDHAAEQSFFADPVYREIRHRLFEKAVKQVVVIAEYTR